EGIKRAKAAIAEADRILLVIDSRRDHVDAGNLARFLREIGLESLESQLNRLTLIRNKIDLSGDIEGVSTDNTGPITIIGVSAKRQQGLDVLRQHLKDCMGYQPA